MGNGVRNPRSSFGASMLEPALRDHVDPRLNQMFVALDSIARRMEEAADRFEYAEASDDSTVFVSNTVIGTGGQPSPLTSIKLPEGALFMLQTLVGWQYDFAGAANANWDFWQGDGADTTSMIPLGATGHVMNPFGPGSNGICVFPSPGIAVRGAITGRLSALGDQDPAKFAAWGRMITPGPK